MHGAYEGLPDKIKHRLDGLSAIHDFTRVFGRRFNPEVREQMQRKYPSVEHPVVRTHPETGAKGIYVNAAFTVCIKDMGDEESTELLQAAVPAGRHPRVPMPVALAERHARVLGQPFHAALRRLRLLARGARDGARHGRRRPSLLKLASPLPYGRVIASSRWPSGSEKYTPRPPSWWLISPGFVLHRVRPVVDPALGDATEDLVELLLRHDERVVLSRDLTIGLVVVERHAVRGLDHEERCVARRGR